MSGFILAIALWTSSVCLAAFYLLDPGRMPGNHSMFHVTRRNSPARQEEAKMNRKMTDRRKRILGSLGEIAGELKNKDPTILVDDFGEKP
jgi:hypothetical protein